MAHSTVAATILGDIVNGRDKPWAALYDASRFKTIASAKDFVKKNVNFVKRFVGDRVSHTDSHRELDAIEPGQGESSPSVGAGGVDQHAHGPKLVTGAFHRLLDARGIGVRRRQRVERQLPRRPR